MGIFVMTQDKKEHIEIKGYLDDLILKCSIRSREEREKEVENTFEKIKEYLEYIRSDDCCKH